MSIGLDDSEYEYRFKHMGFRGGRFSGKTGFDAFQALLSAINANLERNDLLPVGASIGFTFKETPLCINIEPCTTWEAFEHFAAITGSQVRWEHTRVCFRAVAGASEMK